MKNAVRRPGALRRKAAAAGQSTAEFAREHASDEGRTGKQARLAMTFAKFRPGRKRSKKASASKQAKALRGGGGEMESTGGAY